jgi:hypothetical protein
LSRGRSRGWKNSPRRRAKQPVRPAGPGCESDRQIGFEIYYWGSYHLPITNT